MAIETVVKRARVGDAAVVSYATMERMLDTAAPPLLAFLTARDGLRLRAAGAAARAAVADYQWPRAHDLPVPYNKLPQWAAALPSAKALLICEDVSRICSPLLLHNAWCLSLMPFLCELHIASYDVKVVKACLSWTPRLTTLCLEQCPDGSMQDVKMGDVLRRVPQLRTLRVSHYKYNTFSMCFGDALAYVPALTVLELNNAFQGGVHAAKLVAELTRVPQLTHLRLRYNGICGPTAHLIASALAFLPRLVELDLSHNAIGFVGNGGGGMYTGGVVAIADALVNTPRLRCLRLTANAICTEGAQAIAQRGLHHVPKLEVLALGVNHINCPGMRTLMSHFQHVQQLVEFDVHKNLATPATVRELGAALARLPRLQYIDVSDCWWMGDVFQDADAMHDAVKAVCGLVPAGVHVVGQRRACCRYPMCNMDCRVVH